MRPLLLPFLAACQDPTPDPAIEITGYLDGARISWTVVGSEVQAAGREGAAEPGSSVTLSNGDGEREVPVSDEGTFVVSAAAEEGDALVLVSGEDQLAHVVPPHGPFPAHDHVWLYADPHEPGSAVVEVTFVPARDDGAVWVTDPEAGQVVVLDVFDTGHLHGGHVAGEPGDLVRLHWVPDVGVESAAIEVPVAAAAP